MKIFNNKIIILLGALIVATIGTIAIKKINTDEEKLTSSVQQEVMQDMPAAPGPMNGQNMRGGNREVSKGNCLGEDCLAVSDIEYPVAELPAEVVDALNSAIDDEYKAFATYDAVINEFGSVRPFIMIIRAEEQHISSLKALFDKYGLEIPENPYVGNIEAPPSLAAACNTGVTAEIDNATLYQDDLLPAVTDYEDITAVFNSLMRASQEKHLPAFERCSN